MSHRSAMSECLLRPCLMLVTDSALCGGPEGLVEVLEEAVRAGVDAVQLRERSLSDEELLSLARRVREITAGRALFLVNGRRDVALAAGADGLHLPEGLPSAERPRPGFLLGRSVHSLGAALHAHAEGMDYLVAGPVFDTRSHPGVRPAGPDLIREIAAAVPLPVLGIGGITADRVAAVMQAGAAGIAVISAVLAAPSPAEAVRGLRQGLKAALAEGNRVLL